MALKQTLISAFLSLLALPAHAGLETHGLTIDGQRRSYLLYVPDHAAPATGRRLVVVLHGGGGSSRQIHRSVGGAFDALAETDGTLIAYPNAIDRMWDLGADPVSGRMTNPRDDLKFLTAMVAEIERADRVDRRRVFATGISRGGQATYFLACRAPGIFRAIAPVAMSLPDFLADDCAQVPPTPILVINGVQDPIVPYGGGPITIGRKDRGEVIGTPATMRLFAGRNGCSGRIASQPIGHVDRLSWTGCRAPTELLQVRDGGHGWPGERSVLPGWIVGPANRDIDATREIWAFFARF